MKKIKITGAIVGMRFRPNISQDDIDGVSSSSIQLLREPHNPHDSNAVKCIVKGKHFGYINREAAENVSPLLVEGAEYSISIGKQFDQSIQVDLYFTIKDQKPQISSTAQGPDGRPERKSLEKPKAVKQRTTAQRGSVSSQDDRCFIASYIYGIEDPRTCYFRSFRDQTLLPTRVGRLLVRIYYALSPLVVAACSRSNRLESSIRKQLDLHLPAELRE
jgi:hypothetical protein